VLPIYLSIFGISKAGLEDVCFLSRLRKLRLGDFQFGEDKMANYKCTKHYKELIVPRIPDYEVLRDLDRFRLQQEQRLHLNEDLNLLDKCENRNEYVHLNMQRNESFPYNYNRDLGSLAVDVISPEG